tara:strand:- start:126 stop:473 length:348 start_codon:yes stop_codon:yes gene_type:complete
MDKYNECLKILEDKKTLDEEPLYEKWDLFKKETPELFKFLVKTQEIDMSILKKLCLQSSIVTPENKREKDKEVGEMLAEKYLYPTFGRPTEKQMKEAEKTVERVMERKKGNVKLK